MLSDLAEQLKKNSGFRADGVDQSLRIWMHWPEFVDIEIEKNEKIKGFWRSENLDNQLVGLKKVKEYLEPHENSSVQRLSELFRNNQ